jgi:hypothetical protein
MVAEYPLPAAYLQAQNFARLALGQDLKRAAANLAIRGERLRGDAGVNEQFKILATERALDIFGYLHGAFFDRSG